ncbi:Metalloprotease mmpA [Actinomyces bovis]|uniref:Metalloprotease mmpA n=1 Tax=Actinomyces bovis TaxID=1658 RepID=A0ABY1VKL1_9ACTO|nr:site-2 protease family protein [Actinomyces bovis]SPT52634.1 Metalloprotease mmpA [Actinomyces bovis]VEG54510.1 Metalloprotease mmpA [Actinomyces israelii]
MNLYYLLGILILVIGLAVSVALHELGHMIPAKLFGVKVSEYFIGFGPKIWSIKRGETEYGVKALWLGGYVRLLGMLPPAPPGRPDKPGSLVADSRKQALSELGPEEQHRAFYRLSVPKKLVVMAGGILTNLALGIIVLSFAVGVIGVPGHTNTLSSVSECLKADLAGTSACSSADPISPAAVAGFQVGDQVLSWGGQSVSNWAQVQEAIKAGGLEPTQVVVRRGGAEQTLTVTATQVQRPVLDKSGKPMVDASGKPVTEPRPYVGIGPSLGNIPQPASALPSTIGQAVGGTLKAIFSLPVGLYHAVAAGLGLEQRSTDGVIGLVGIGRIAGEAASAGTTTGPTAIPLSVRAFYMLSLLGSLNLALFAFNLIPLLPLDGGHVAGALWEGVRRRLALAQGRPDPGPVDTAKMLPVGQVVFGLLIIMTLVLVWVDVVAPV